MSAPSPRPDELSALQQALDDLDRLRMAAGYDHRVPIVEVIADVERLLGVEGRAQHLWDQHPDERVRLVARHIVTAEPSEVPR